MFKRIGNLIKGFFGLFVGGLERKNPEALLEVEKENLREQIAKYNKGLAGHAALCERLISQTRALEAEEKELHAKVVAHLRAGNKELAGQYALRHQQVKKEHATISAQMEEAEKTYKELLTARDVSVKAAREKIESLKRGINEAKIAQATAELNEMASGMINEIGSAGDTLNRLEEIVREDKEKAAGRARVAKGNIDMSGISVKAVEQAAMQDMALADFAAAEGIALDKPVVPETSAPAGGTTESTKTMGPAQTE
jgi:phage shock protein A